MTLDEALEAYWDAAYAEGQAGATHDTPDGRAQCALQAVHSCVRIAITAERERCADPIPAKAVKLINDECRSLGLDYVAFAWRIQKAAADMAEESPGSTGGGAV